LSTKPGVQLSSAPRTAEAMSMRSSVTPSAKRCRGSSALLSWLVSESSNRRWTLRRWI
jgi:hypothetical protein